jgi:integrase/recombinase XerD
VRENPFAKVKLEKRQRNKPAVINEGEPEEICKHINNNIIASAIRFDCVTGLRAGELVNVRWSNIDFDKRILTVGDHTFTTKGRKQRFIPLCDKAIALLSGVLYLKKKEDGYVFTKSNGMKYTTDCISKNFKRACRAAGVDERIHLHTIRHSFGSNLVQKGVPLYTVKELLGHSSLACTEIYCHLNLDSLREAVNKL